jgi:hypothetical protein
MKTRSGWSHLRGLLLLSALGGILCTSAYAGPTIYRDSAARTPTALDMPAQKTVKIFIMSSASAIPKPISWIIGGVITTATPIQIVGREQTVSR